MHAQAAHIMGSATRACNTLLSGVLEGEAEGEQGKPGWDASSAMPPGDLPEQAASLGDPPELSWCFFPSMKSRHLGREAASSWQSHHAYRGQKITGRDKQHKLAQSKSWKSNPGPFLHRKPATPSTSPLSPATSSLHP